MYRVLCRDHVSEAEIRSLWRLESSAEEPEINLPQKVDLDPADLESLGPWLLLITANQRAEEIVARASRDAGRIRAAAQEEALGLRAEMASQELGPTATAFANAAQSLIVFEEQLLAVYRPHLVRLALEIAEKIVDRTVTEHPEIVQSVLQRARKETVNAGEIRIWLHPSDHELLAQVAPHLLQSSAGSGRKLEVLCSEDIARGGCRLETEMGVIDATIPTQLEEIHRQLLDEEKKSA